MQLSEIDSKWRGLVDGIYKLHDEVRGSLNEESYSGSLEKRQLQDYDEMLADILKVINGN